MNEQYPQKNEGRGHNWRENGEFEKDSGTVQSLFLCLPAFLFLLWFVFVFLIVRRRRNANKSTPAPDANAADGEEKPLTR
jgi:hypothetical protein